MVQAQSITHTVVYTYNGDGVRRAMAVDGLVTYWTQDTDGLAEVLIEHTPTGATFYLLGLSRLAQVEGSEAEWFLGDGLGSVRQLVDDDGVVVLAQRYDPYGQLLSQSGTGSSGYGFTGEQADPTGLIYLRARYFHPALGRFISVDPFLGYAALPGTLHAYAYCLNNPINYLDPSGEQPAVLVAIVAAVVALELIDPLPLEAIVWPAAIYLVGQSVIAGAKAAPDIERAIRLLQRSVKERTRTQPGVIGRDMDPVPLTWPEQVNRNPAPLPKPTPDPNSRPYTNPKIDPWIPSCPPRVTMTPRPGEHRVLTVGEGDFGYSWSLHALHPDWKITGTSYGGGSNSQIFAGGDGNLALYTDVDATRLGSGPVTGQNQYDAIVFNNPYAGAQGEQTASLIRNFIQSARSVLAPGGEIHINVTQQLLKVNEGARSALGLPADAGASVFASLPTFGQTRYYAPFIPHYTEGGAMGHYRRDPALAAGLKNFVFH